jgi:hypothetical protein
MKSPKLGLKGLGLLGRDAFCFEAAGQELWDREAKKLDACLERSQ